MSGIFFLENTYVARLFRTLISYVDFVRLLRLVISLLVMTAMLPYFTSRTNFFLPT
jgi:hypothetical protein